MSACEPLLRTKFTASNVGSFEQSDAYGAIVTKVEASTRSNGVYGVTPHACRGVVRQLELAKNPTARWLRGQRAIGTVIETHPAVAAQQHRMLHHRRGYHTGLYCEGARGLIGSEKLDAQADARRSLQRGRLAKTTQGTRGAIPLARNGCCPHRERAIQYVASDKILWGTSIKERHPTIGRDGVSSTVNRNLRGKRGVVESNDTVDEAGAIFW